MEKNFTTSSRLTKSAKLITVLGLAILAISPAVAEPLPGTRGGQVYVPPGQPVPNYYNNYNPANPYNPYARTSGFYTPPYLGVNYPAFGVPQAIGGGFFRIPSGQTMLPMWQAPSGYYYPWAFRPRNFVYAYPLPILVIQNQNPEPALPPLSVVFTDMTKYLDENKKDKKITEYDYGGMIRRVKDLQSKERTLRIAASGSLDPADEAQIRRDLDQVGSELSWRVSRESK
jgi:hypothetical protein